MLRWREMLPMNIKIVRYLLQFAKCDTGAVNLEPMWSLVAGLSVCDF